MCVEFIIMLTFTRALDTIVYNTIFLNYKSIAITASI